MIDLEVHLASIPRQTAFLPGITQILSDGGLWIVSLTPRPIGEKVVSLAETHEMMELVKAGKIDPIPVSERPLGEGSKSLDDLRKGTVMGHVVLKL